MKLLNYFRCNDCLTSFTSYEPKVEICACGGDCEYLGRVKGLSVWQTATACACDERCTNASGPNCDCSCGGANHGTGKVIQVEIYMGKFKIFSQIDAKSYERAVEYRLAKQNAEERFNLIHGQNAESIRQGVWIDRSVYFKTLNARKELNKAAALKVHKTRINRLNSLFQPETVSQNETKAV